MEYTYVSWSLRPALEIEQQNITLITIPAGQGVQLAGWLKIIHLSVEGTSPAEGGLRR